MKFERQGSNLDEYRKFLHFFLMNFVVVAVRPCIFTKTDRTTLLIQSHIQSPQTTHFVPSSDRSHAMHTISPIPIEAITHELPDAADSSDSDHEDFANKDTVTQDDFKPTSFRLVTEADIVMDMDSVVEYFEDDDYPWEEMFGEHGSESGAGTDRDEEYESS
jgi:hypothetical protein